MGKYSLDAFERYPLVKLRPKMAAPEQDCYRLVPEGPGLRSLRTADDRVAAVVLTCWDTLETYRERFGQVPLLVEPGTELSRHCAREGLETGLWLPLDRGILALRRAIGEEGLSRRWECYPVYVCAGRELTPEELDAARRWHASGADCLAVLGPRMTLRRMMFPEGLTSGGVMPLRMWWQNLGTAPLYRDVQVQLELRGRGERFPILVPEEMPRPGLGDSTLNTTAQLPAVPSGTYGLWCGLASQERLLPLAMDAPEEKGMCHIGDVSLDAVPRPYLATLWEEQYADGYYPLEDPVQPE